MPILHCPIKGHLWGSIAASVVPSCDRLDLSRHRVNLITTVSQQLMSCNSLGDMQQIYTQYMRTAFEQYREQSERAVQRGKSTIDGLARTLELGTREFARGVPH